MTRMWISLFLVGMGSVGTMGLKCFSTADGKSVDCSSTKKFCYSTYDGSDKGCTSNLGDKLEPNMCKKYNLNPTCLCEGDDCNANLKCECSNYVKCKCHGDGVTDCRDGLCSNSEDTKGPVKVCKKFQDGAASCSRFTQDLNTCVYDEDRKQKFCVCEGQECNDDKEDCGKAGCKVIPPSPPSGPSPSRGASQSFNFWLLLTFTPMIVCTHSNFIS